MLIIHRRSFLWAASILLIAAAVVLGLWLRAVPAGRSEAVAARSAAPAADPEGASAPRELGEVAGGFLGVVLARQAVDVAAEVSGQLLEVRVRPGSPVARDEVVATLDTRLLQHQLTRERAQRKTAEARYRRSAVEVAKAEKEEDRRQALGDLVSAEEAERARFQTETAAAALEEAEAEVTQAAARIEELEARLARSLIRAPFAGTVALRYLDPGAVVSPATPVVRLISTADLMARFAVPSAQASGIAVGAPVRLTLDDQEEPLAGVVDHVAPEIDAASRMVFVEARLEVSAESARSISFGALARVAVGEDQPAS